MFRIAFATFVALYALLHLLGFVKAFGNAPFDGLGRPISRGMGLLWLAAALLLGAGLVLLFLAPRWFWIVSGMGLLASQIAVVSAWSAARFGTLPNLVLLLAVTYGAFAWGPFGVRAEYEQLVNEALRQTAKLEPVTITEADLAGLPEPVQRYLHVAGVVGTPRVRGFRAQMTGRIRGSADAEWMSFSAEQYNFFDPPRRYFWLEAVRGGLPVDGLHAYGQTDASMRIRLLSLIPVVDLGGQDLMRTETVTVLNDMSIFAPGSLLDPSIRWQQQGAHNVEATYVNGPHTVRAVLVFDDSGVLVNFWSDDRPALAEDGKTLQPQRWSTPVHDYRTVGPYHLFATGEARYAAPSGDYAYAELEVIEVVVNPVTGR
jgi:hypothetical protein